MADINSLLFETISGVRVVKAFGMEDYEVGRFKTQNQEFYRLKMKSVQRSLLISPITEFIGAICGVAICWMNDPGSLESTLRQAGVRQVIVRSPHSPTLQAIHTADRYVEILKPWGIRRDDGQALLMPRENFHPTSAFPAAGSPATIAVHPGSGSSVKCYDAHRLATVIRLLQSRYNPRFLVLSGPADEAATTRLLDQVPGVEASVIRDTGLTTVAGILAKVQVFIGQDSGITHLAAALGVPTIALFGPTDPERWAPQGRRVLVLRGSPCMCVGSEQVKCCQFRPCLEIPVEHIVHAVERYLLNQSDHAHLPWSERVC
jgi:ADP-heptose:LPS heptosyltransferase